MSEWGELNEAERSQLVDKWCEFFGAQGFDTFFTLTWDQTKCASMVSADVAIERAKSLLSEFFNRMGGDVAAFVAAEENTRGGFHVHGLCRTGVHDQATKRDYWFWLWKMGFDRYGRCQFGELADGGKGYVMKYCAKGPSTYRLFGRGLAKMAPPS